MILGLDYGDPERLIIIILLVLSLYQMWKGHLYDKYLKIIMTVPRVYLILYYFIVVVDIYRSTAFESAVRSGLFSLYGMLLLFGVEVYVRWVSRKYGNI